MSKLKFAVLVGLVFGVVDLIPMIAMELPDKLAAMSGAFINRFSIGFIIPLVKLDLTGWQRGLLFGTMLSLPDAIITRAYAPILGFGVIGGLIVGFIVQWWERKHQTQAL